jgi:hypothetical protein
MIVATKKEATPLLPKLSPLLFSYRRGKVRIYTSQLPETDEL